MAKPKQAILVEEFIWDIWVWTDTPEEDSVEIRRIEGIDRDNILISSELPKPKGVGLPASSKSACSQKEN